jgi:hypothetical protein
VILGFVLLPGTPDLNGPAPSDIAVYVDRPGVRMVAALDARYRSGDPHMHLELYADTPPGGSPIPLVILSSPHWVAMS